MDAQHMSLQATPALASPPAKRTHIRSHAFKRVHTSLQASPTFAAPPAAQLGCSVCSSPEAQRSGRSGSAQPVAHQGSDRPGTRPQHTFMKGRKGARRAGTVISDPATDSAPG
eukprot:772193-Pelagomonas_calceolata.AAC.5